MQRFSVERTMPQQALGGSWQCLRRYAAFFDGVLPGLGAKYIFKLFGDARQLWIMPDPGYDVHPKVFLMTDLLALIVRQRHRKRCKSSRVGTPKFCSPS